MAPNDMENTTDEGKLPSDNVPVVDPNVSAPAASHSDTESDALADNAPSIATGETLVSEPIICAPAPLPVVHFESDAEDICNISDVEIREHTAVHMVHEGTEHSAAVRSVETNTTESSLDEDAEAAHHLGDVESARLVNPESRKRAAGHIPLPPQVTAEEDCLRLEQAQKSAARAVATQSQATSPDVLCPSCGRQTRTGFTFCTKCGTDFPVDFMQSTAGKAQNPVLGVEGKARDMGATLYKIQGIHHQESREDKGTPQDNMPAGFFGGSVLVNPIACAAISAIFPGLGNIVAGDRKNGIAFLIAGIMMMFFSVGGTLVIGMRILSAILAFQTATQRLRDRENDDSNPKA